ncbi:L-carnitine CoA-transferase [Pectinatus frisingensis]|uniref:L-carnitine CoA-transferase n=1 Tax=Pectinatus frisingensis TaxID=865 RepID=UPI0018C5EEEF|nr:L-carnitine CoA-transferase [Pectinatus frisingensis]
MNNIDIPKFGNLQGLKVVYSAIETAVPFAAHIMAQWGANVIWIENTFGGDSARSGLYSEQERVNQRSIALNIFSEEGKKVLLDLIKDADIFIESGKGNGFTNHGISDDDLWEANKSLVIVHVSGFGRYGEDNMIGRGAYDGVIQAFSGYLHQNGFADRPPVAAFPYTGDYFTSFFVLGSSLAGVYNAQKTGKGESIDLAMYEALLATMSCNILDYLNYGKVYPRAGNRDPLFIGYGVYQCKEGYVYMALWGKRAVANLFELIGLSHLIGTEDYPEGIGIIKKDSVSAKLIEEKINKYFAGKTAKESEMELNDRGISCSRVMDFKQIANHPHYKLREDFIKWDTDDRGKFTGINVVPKFANNPGLIWRGKPGYGSDNESILRDAGYSDEKIRRLYEKGTITNGNE